MLFALQLPLYIYLLVVLLLRALVQYTRNTQIFQGKFQIADLRPAIWSLEKFIYFSRLRRAFVLLNSVCPTAALLLPCCCPITALLLPYYCPITALLLPYYCPIITTAIT